MNAKGFFFRVAALSSILAFCGVQNRATAANLLVNPGFETGDFTGWTQSGNGIFTSVQSSDPYPHTGQFGAAFGPTGTSGFISQTLATVSGQSYDLSYWLSNLGSPPNSFEALWNGNTVLMLTDQTEFGYTLYTAVVQATSASSTVSFGFRHDPSFWAFDDASVEAQSTGTVPDAGSSIVMLGVALLGLAGIRRIRR